MSRSRSRSRQKQRHELKNLLHELRQAEEDSWQKLQSCEVQEEAVASRRSRRLLAAAARQGLAAAGFGDAEATAAERRCTVLRATSRHGNDVDTHNAQYKLQNHQDMVQDQVRVQAFWQAIQRAAQGKKV
ncbi:unnamed protein product, partial [Effrenium voratum]